MSSASTEADTQVALNLARELNANPRRECAARSEPQGANTLENSAPGLRTVLTAPGINLINSRARQPEGLESIAGTSNMADETMLDVSDGLSLGHSMHPMRLRSSTRPDQENRKLVTPARCKEQVTGQISPRVIPAASVAQTLNINAGAPSDDRSRSQSNAEYVFEPIGSSLSATPLLPPISSSTIEGNELLGQPVRTSDFQQFTSSPANLHFKKRKADDDDNEFIPSNAKSNRETGDEGVVASPACKNGLTSKRATGYVRYHQSMQGDKPAPYGEPPVWADKRQSLCEALPYYKAYMSGAYMHFGVVSAFMIDKEVGPRDKFDEEIVIARVGGCRKLDEETGRMVQKSDQDVSAVSLGFERARKEGKPVAVIAGQGNRICPSKLPHYYNVLDWFQVTDVWCEKYAGLKCWMVRLEKIDVWNKSWWAATDSPSLDVNRDINAFKATVQACNVCRRSSKQIFNEGWTCLNPSCRDYFKFDKGVDDSTLDYNENFMRERTVFTGTILQPLVPPPMSFRQPEMTGEFGYEKAFKSGIVCPLCKGCSRRIEWNRWTCETPGCTFVHEVPQETMEVHDAIAAGFNFEREVCNEAFGIRRGQKPIGLYDVHEYIIPGALVNEVAGVIMHFKANGIINGQTRGPNDLFRQMQVEDYGLKRHPARQKGGPGEMLTSHWAANWGAPYKYGVSVLSKGFDEAPSSIIMAVKRLTWAGEQTVTERLEPFHAFNELLSIGYFEDSTIGYHDDGEKELGPTVATLSLGCQATMALRPKAKSGLGADSKNTKGTKPDVLRMTIRHGDIVVMHGSGIQKLYEHAVTPKGKLRFALTCRYVRPELMANDEERRQAEIKAKLPDGHKKYTYHGETDNQLLQIDQGSENIAAAQRSMNDLAGRALSGQLDQNTLRMCRSLFGEILRIAAVPEVDREAPRDDTE